MFAEETMIDYLAKILVLLVERVLGLEMPEHFARWWQAIKARPGWQATRAAEKAPEQKATEQPS